MINKSGRISILRVAAKSIHSGGPGSVSFRSGRTKNATGRVGCRELFRSLSVVELHLLVA